MSSELGMWGEEHLCEDTINLKGFTIHRNKNNLWYLRNPKGMSILKVEYCPICGEALDPIENRYWENVRILIENKNYYAEFEHPLILKKEKKRVVRRLLGIDKKLAVVLAGELNKLLSMKSPWDGYSFEKVFDHASVEAVLIYFKGTDWEQTVIPFIEFRNKLMDGEKGVE